MNKCGTLVIPDGIEPIKVNDGEIARQYAAQENTFLFANPPSIATQQALNGQDSKIEIQYFGGGAEQLPALLIDKNQNILVGITGQIKEGEIVLARDVPGDNTVMQVATFEKAGKAHDNMPETGEGIVIKNKGYMLKSQLSPDQSNQESFNRPLLNQFRSIFPNDNLTEDVRQYKFGDCFLLSSILAILNQKGGEEYIRSLMIQNGESTIVKLYDPNERKFVYYEISNTYHQKSDSTSVLHKAPWVHILEKAYAAHAYKKNNQTEHDDRQFITTFPAFREIFGSGGHPDVALTVLTGIPSKEHIIESGTNIPWSSDNIMYCVSTYKRISRFINEFNKHEISKIDSLLSGLSKQSETIDFLLKLSSGTSDYDEYHNLSEEAKSILAKLSDLIAPKILSAQDEEDKMSFLSAFSEYIQLQMELRYANDFSIIPVLKNIGNISQLGKYLVEELPAEEYLKFLMSVLPNSEVSQFTNAACTFDKLQRLNPKPPEEVMHAFLKYLSPGGTIQRWDGELGTGIYSDNSLSVFAEISKCLDSSSESNAIVASTKFRASPDTVGLRPQHAYAVVGTKEKTVNNLQLKFITVRNPWGRTGRAYHWDRVDEMTVEDNSVKAATFDVELSDFTRYFYKYTIGQYGIEPGQETEMTNKVNYQLSDTEVLIIGVVLVGVIAVAITALIFYISLPVIAGLCILFSAVILGTMILNKLEQPNTKPTDLHHNSTNVGCSSAFWKPVMSPSIEEFNTRDVALNNRSLNNS